MKKSILVMRSILILISISACSSSQSVVITDIPTSMPSPIHTSTPVPTDIPTDTPIPPTNTPGLPGRIVGTVVNTSGTPLPGITVKLFKGRDLVTEISTDDEGQFALENIPAGKYYIQYDYFPEGGFAIHYKGDEFILESEATSEQNYEIPIN